MGEGVGSGHPPQEGQQWREQPAGWGALSSGGEHSVVMGNTQQAGSTQQ